MAKDYTINKKFPLSDMQNEIVEFLLQRRYACNAAQTGLRENLHDTYSRSNSNVTG